MHLLRLFKLGTHIMNDCLHMHAIFFFRHQIQHGPLVAILLLKCVPNHVSDSHHPIIIIIIFKLGTSTVHDGTHMHLTLFCNLIKDG